MKVSRKVGRRNHSRGSSISRRRFRNNKNKKSGSRKKYAHTHTIKGGCWSGAKKGGARSRKYGHKRTHKRGKRFHRGGVGIFGDSDIEPTIAATREALGEDALPPTFGQQALPKQLRRLDRMDNTLSFEYKRTDKIYAFNPISEPGVFDVAVDIIEDDYRKLKGIYLVRHDKNDMTMPDKYLSIPSTTWTNYDSTRAFTGIKGFTGSSESDGTYTFPATDTNRQSFEAVKNFLNTLKLTA